MLMFSTVRQTHMLQHCQHIISDGSFKYSPLGSNQIYRVFGLIRGTHATPLVTVLLKKKTKEVYKKMWEKRKLRLSYLEITYLIFLVKETMANREGVVHSIQFASFDAEKAAYTSFAETFPGVKVKICAFHAKQGLYRKLQSLGLSTMYRTEAQVQRIVRMIGALQITPIVEWNPCLRFLVDKIAATDLDRGVKQKLEVALHYFR